MTDQPRRMGPMRRGIVKFSVLTLKALASQANLHK
jgi:hypothetical protein